MLVTPDQFEASLDSVRGSAAGPREGLFGPRSITWRVDREAALFLGAGRALFLQLAHPWVAAAVTDQSQVFADPVGRFHRTFNVTFTMVFGSLDQAIAAARRLFQRHTAVVGVLPCRAGPFAAGSAYQANDVAALGWVHATLVETALLAHDLVLPELSAGEREQYWSEARLHAALFGIPANGLACDWASFAAYNEAMHASDVLTVTPAARDIARQIFSGRVTGIRPPLWYRALTAQLLPARLRDAFELPLGESELRSAQRALTWIRRIYPSLPQRLRTVGPYQEALARIDGRDRPSAVTRGLNRLWIGRSSMAQTRHDGAEQGHSRQGNRV
jgi:uncharacterized protein (DUF2236 family)